MKLFLFLLLTTNALQAQTAEPPSLEVVLSLNGRDQAVLQPGEALIASAAFLSSGQTRERAATASLTLWRSDGTQVENDLHERETNTSLAEGQELVLRLWTVSPEVTAKLPPGEYLAWLESEGQEPAAARFRVEASISADDLDHQAMRCLMLSRWLELEAQFDQAVQVAEELIALQPDNLAARIRRADALTAAGRLDDALAALNNAERQYASLHPAGTHPPVLIQKRQEKLLKALGQGDDTLDGVSSRKP
ncbi:MAG: tetratricopeptide repeat protein [Acidobacteria bacterium]|nr:tetratricopeptide repeat protein [Acidobacteriota bacterium]